MIFIFFQLYFIEESCIFDPMLLIIPIHPTVLERTSIQSLETPFCQALHILDCHLNKLKKNPWDKLYLQFSNRFFFPLTSNVMQRQILSTASLIVNF